MCPPGLFQVKQSVTQSVQVSQLKTEQSDKASVVPGFGGRLRDAFGGDINRRIAEKLEISEPAVKNYLNDRVPPAKTLIEIARLTDCSLHWLITGEGPKKAGIISALALTDLERKIIQKLAEEAETSFDVALLKLLRDALFKRGSEMLANFYDLSRENLSELQLLMGLIVSEGKAVKQIDLSPQNRLTGSGTP